MNFVSRSFSIGLLPCPFAGRVVKSENFRFPFSVKLVYSQLLSMLKVIFEFNLSKVFFLNYWLFLQICDSQAVILKDSMILFFSVIQIVSKIVCFHSRNHFQTIQHHGQLHYLPHCKRFECKIFSGQSTAALLSHVGSQKILSQFQMLNFVHNSPYVLRKTVLFPGFRIVI